MAAVPALFRFLGGTKKNHAAGSRFRVENTFAAWFLITNYTFLITHCLSVPLSVETCQVVGAVEAEEGIAFVVVDEDAD